MTDGILPRILERALAPALRASPKASPRPRIADADHLVAFREEYGRSSRSALLLHTGDAVSWLADGVLAAPWWAAV